MTDKHFEEPEDPSVPEPAEGASSSEGSEASSSGPAPQVDPDELTIEDILAAAQTAEAAAEDADTVADRVEALESTLLTDLKRLQAEYANYRRRTEEQREIEIERATGAVAKGLLPVLDDLDRADKHGDLAEGSAFAVIAEKIRGVVERLGVQVYGAAGDLFDPQQHEAIFQAPTPGTEVATILEVVEVGYRLGDIELRPAKVVVAVPADPSTGSGTDATGSGTDPSTGTGTD